MQFYSSIISFHDYSISEFYGVMIILSNSCHGIESSLYKNCKDKLFNVKTRTEEMKLKLQPFSDLLMVEQIFLSPQVK